MTTQEQFQKLKDKVFPTVDVTQVVNMSDEEQRDFLLKQADRLLANKDHKVIEWLVNQFWEKTDEWMPRWNNPLQDPETREDMDDDERLLCAFYVSLSDLCRALYYYEPFDTFSIGVTSDDDFLIDNKPLVDFVRTSPYPHVNAFIAYIMRRVALSMLSENGYLAAYDYLNKLVSRAHRCIIGKPQSTELSSSEYVDITLKALTAVDHHLAEGGELGLSLEQIILYDEMIGQFTDNYDDVVVEAVKLKR